MLKWLTSKFHVLQMMIMGVRAAEVSMQVIRADGSIEDFGMVSHAHINPFWWFIDEVKMRKAEADRLAKQGEKQRFDRSNLSIWLYLLGIGSIVVGLLSSGAVEYVPIIIGATVLNVLGRAIITGRIRGLGTEPVWAFWGTGAGTAAAADTDLFTPSVDEIRIQGTASQVTTTSTNDTYQVVATIICLTNNKNITNAALFDAASAGNIFMKGDFASTALIVNDAIQFTFKIQFS